MNSVYVPRPLSSIVSGAPPAAEARLEGTVYASGLLLGRIDGVIQFVDDNGRTGNCPATSWMLQPDRFVR